VNMGAQVASDGIDRLILFLDADRKGRFHNIDFGSKPSRLNEVPGAALSINNVL
jgi:hypothetical protein